MKNPQKSESTSEYRRDPRSPSMRCLRNRGYLGLHSVGFRPPSFEGNPEGDFPCIILTLDGTHTVYKLFMIFQSHIN